MASHVEDVVRRATWPNSSPKWPVVSHFAEQFGQMVRTDGVLGPTYAPQDLVST